MRHLSLLIFLASLSPAMAQDQQPPNLVPTAQGSPGGVARLYLSQQLYSLGLANNDALSVLNAARLAASVVLTETPRTRETNGEAPSPSSPRMLSPDQMFDAAARLSAQDDGLLDLVDAARREAKFFPVVTVISTTSTLAPARTDTWRQPFFGQSLAEIAVIGDAQNPLDLRVTDTNGNPLCLGAGTEAARYCSFYPAENGQFQIVVTNLGDAAFSYALVTN